MMLLSETEGFKKLSKFLDTYFLVEKAMDSNTHFNNILDWMVLEEERLEAKILLWFDNQKQEMLKRFDSEFVDFYEQKDLVKKAIVFLSNIDLEPRIKYKQVGIFRFKKHTIPTECKEWFQKDEQGAKITFVSLIDPKELKESLDESMFRSYSAGGQSSLTLLDISLTFQMTNKWAENRIKDYIFQLTTQITAQIQSEVQLQLLEGIRDFEGIPELRNRILSIWNNPIQVNVPPKIEGGQVVRSGYSYQLSSQQWATTVARTEVAKAFQWGKIDAYKQTGLVNMIEWSAAPDERTCPVCRTRDGEKYLLEESYLLFPAHANCRCTPIPIVEYKGDIPVDEVMTDNITTLYESEGLL